MTSNPPDGPPGYGNPPKASQFKPGQSGNPRGRPKEKKDLTLHGAIQKGMQEPVTLTVGGKRRTMSRVELIMTQLMNKAAIGDLKAIETLIKLEKNAPPPDRLTGLVGAAERLTLKFQLVRERQKERAQGREDRSLQRQNDDTGQVAGERE